MFRKITTILVFISFTYSIGNAYVAVNAELESANNLANKGIINNHASDPVNYNLLDNVLRQEIAAVARGVAKLEKKDRCDNIFTDVSDTIPNNWACRNIEVLVDNDLISKNTTFRPEDKITKSEAVAMLIKAIGFDYTYNPNGSGNWQKQVVDFAVEAGVVDSFTDYDSNATRGWIFTLANTTIRIDEEIKLRINIDNIYSDEANIN